MFLIERKGIFIFMVELDILCVIFINSLFMLLFFISLCMLDDILFISFMGLLRKFIEVIIVVV